jgi:hypothetical protein
VCLFGDENADAIKPTEYSENRKMKKEKLKIVGLALVFILLLMLIYKVTAMPALTLVFISPTPDSNTYQTANFAEINISITESSLDTFKFNWNGTNYTLYNSSLVLAMNFNNNSAIGENSTYAVDISKYGNNGTIHDAVWNSSGKFEHALTFDGIDDYIDCGNNASLKIGDNLTVEGWVKLAKDHKSQIMGKGISEVRAELSGGHDVYVLGNYAYVTAWGDDSLTVVDISEPTDPSAIGVVINSTYMDGAHGIYVSGSYAYVTAWYSDSLAVVDISDPANPTVVGGVIDSTYMDASFGVSVSGNYAYVAAYKSNSSAVVDVSDPTNPTVVATLGQDSDLGHARVVRTDGNYAYVTASLDGSLTVIDISNPLSPTKVEVLDSSMDYDHVVWIDGNYAYLTGANNDIFKVIDISDPLNLSVVGSVTDSVHLDWPYGVQVQGNYAYVSSQYSDSLTTIDISDPTDPTVVGFVTHPAMEGARNLYVSGNYAYVISFQTHTLTVIDIANPTNPTVVTTLKDGDGGAAEWMFYKDIDNKVCFKWSSDGTAENVDSLSSSVAVDDSWHYVTTTFSGGEVYVYIDCVSTHKTSTKTSINTENSILKIGYSNWGGGYANGTIDEVRIYNRALSADEIWTHYQSEFQRYNTTQWYFYDNVTNLLDGAHNYTGWVRNLGMGWGRTEKRDLYRNSNPPGATSSQPANQTTAVGVNATYELKITNTGNVIDNFTLAVTKIDPTVDVAELNQTRIIKLGKDASWNVTLDVTSYIIGTFNVTVNVTSERSGSKVNETSKITTMVNTTNVSIIFSPLNRTVATGVNASYEILINNTGNLSAAFNLSVQNLSSADVAYLNEYFTPVLKKFHAYNVTLTITDYNVGTFNVTVTATSQLNPSVSDTTSNITTTVTGPTPTPPPLIAVPECNIFGLLALIGILSVIHEATTLRRR